MKSTANPSRPENIKRRKPDDRPDIKATKGAVTAKPNKNPLVDPNVPGNAAAKTGNPQ